MAEKTENLEETTDGLLLKSLKTTGWTVLGLGLTTIGVLSLGYFLNSAHPPFHPSSFPERDIGMIFGPAGVITCGYFMLGKAYKNLREIANKNYLRSSIFFDD